MAELKELAETLVNLTIKEVTELADILKDEYGIEPAAAAVAVAAGPAGGDAGAAEQTEFDVILSSAGAGKLKVVKELKGLLSLGLIKQLKNSLTNCIILSRLNSLPVLNRVRLQHKISKQLVTGSLRMILVVLLMMVTH